MYDGMARRSHASSARNSPIVHPPPARRSARRWQQRHGFPRGWTYVIAGTCAAVVVQILICVDGKIDFGVLAPRYTSHPALATPFAVAPGRMSAVAPEPGILHLDDTLRHSGAVHAHAPTGATVLVADAGEEREAPSGRETTQCAAMVQAATAVRRRHSGPEPLPGTSSGRLDRDNDAASAATTGYMDRCRLLIGLILMGASEQTLQAWTPRFVGPPLLPEYGPPRNTAKNSIRKK